MNTLIVVATYRGDHFLEKLAPTLKDIPASVRIINTETGGRCTGAYLKAYREHPEIDEFFFMQDSMWVKDAGFLDDFRAKFDPETGAVAWLSFPIAFDSVSQYDFLMERYGDVELPPLGIFGPIMYTTRPVLADLEEKGLLPPIPVNRDQQQALERGWSLAFMLGGWKVAFMDEFSMVRQQASDYKHFHKVFPERP